MKATRKEIYACKTMGELQELAERYGYNYTWCAFVYNARRIKQLRKSTIGSK